MAILWINGWVDGGKRNAQDLRALFEEIARTHNICLDIDIEESLWPPDPGVHENPPLPLANNEITDGPLD